jgi:hypothetical protein
MKPQIGILLIVLIFLGVFAIYSSLPDRVESLVTTGEGLRANTNVVLGDVIINQESGQSKDKGMSTDVDIKSTSGLDEELQGIIEGFSVITDELQSLENAPTEPAQ